MEIFQYSFMQRAFVIAICISIITPLIGQTVVLKGLSNMGEAISHTALSGITLGLIIGIDPIIGAICFSLLATLMIESISKLFNGYNEIATTVVLSTGIGLASIFSGFLKNSSSLTTYMFGSIVAVSNLELILTIILSIIVIIVYLLNYNNLFQIAFDSENARLSGIRVGQTNFIFMIICAITVSLSCKTVGALIVSSLMVLPVACSMKISKSYKQNLFFSIGFAFLFTILGLIISFYYNLKTGGTVVLLGVITLVLLSILNKRD